MKKFLILVSLMFINSIILSGCFRFQSGIILIPKTDKMQLTNPLWSPDGEKIVAVTTIFPMPDFCLFCETPYSEIFIISPSTYNITSFLREESADFFVRGWNPDGTKIVLQSSGGSLGEGVFLIDTNEHNPIPERFIKYGAIDWSHNGKKIVAFDWTTPYTRRELKLIDLATMEETLLYTLTGTNNEYIELSDPSLSPDGKTVAFSYGKSSIDYHSVDSEIYFLDIETKRIAQFTHDSLHDNSSPHFSPDGKLIAYQKFYQDKLERRTVIVELDTGCEWEIPLLDAYTSSWAPDSRKLVIGGFGI